MRASQERAVAHANVATARGHAAGRRAAVVLVVLLASAAQPEAQAQLVRVPTQAR